MMQEPILSVRNLSKTITMHLLGGKTVTPLVDVSFEVYPGEMLAIVGPSGAGKSTLLKCIYRTYLPTSGSIVYWSSNGIASDLATASEQQIIQVRKNDIGYVSQYLKAPPRISAVDVVALAHTQAEDSVGDRRREAASLLSRLNIDQRLQASFPAVFSGGEQQRVNVARALLQPPRLLLLDEPSSALDVVNKRKVIELISETRSRGTAMIGVFHDREMISRLADRVMVLEDGKTARIGKADKVGLSRYVGNVTRSRQ